jgi:hypothetical protein
LERWVESDSHKSWPLFASARFVQQEYSDLAVRDFSSQPSQHNRTTDTGVARETLVFYEKSIQLRLVSAEKTWGLRLGAVLDRTSKGSAFMRPVVFIATLWDRRTGNA